MKFLLGLVVGLGLMGSRQRVRHDGRRRGRIRWL